MRGRFDALVEAVHRQLDDTDMLEHGCTFASSLLDFELLGLKVREHDAHCWEGLQCYAAKFLLTDALGRLRLACCQAEGGPFCRCSRCSIVDRLEKRLCFFGPSPRTLFKELRIEGPLADNPLEWWRGLVQEAEFDHELYAAQMSPCEWRKFLGWRRRFPGEGAEEGLVVETQERQQKLRLFELESQKIQIFRMLLEASKVEVAPDLARRAFDHFNLATFFQTVVNGSANAQAVRSFKKLLANEQRILSGSVRASKKKVRVLYGMPFFYL